MPTQIRVTPTQIQQPVANTTRLAVSDVASPKNVGCGGLYVTWLVQGQIQPLPPAPAAGVPGAAAGPGPGA